MTKAFILAAGRGERMRPLTDHTPKPLLEVGGRALIEHHLLRLAAAGVAEIVINLGWLGAQIRERLGDGGCYGVRIEYSDEGWPALETGGGTRRALSLLGTAPFISISGDIYSDYPLQKLVESARQWRGGDLAHLVLVPNPPFHPRGDFSLIDGRIVEPAQPPLLTYANFAVIDPRLFAAHADGTFPIAPLLRAAAREHRCSAELYTGPWSNVGTPEQLRELAVRLQFPLQAGAAAHNP
ncbi:MAG: nucleotidyltransferase family protein [Solimonas sp.]